MLTGRASYRVRHPLPDNSYFLIPDNPVTTLLDFNSLEGGGSGDCSMGSSGSALSILVSDATAVSLPDLSGYTAPFHPQLAL